MYTPTSRYAPWSRTTFLAERPSWTHPLYAEPQGVPHVRAGRLRILSGRFASVKPCALAMYEVLPKLRRDRERIFASIPRLHPQWW